MRTLRRWGSSICRVGPGWSARACPDREYPGPPDAGNLHVRWDEGEGSRVRPCSLSTLLVQHLENLFSCCQLVAQASS